MNERVLAISMFLAGAASAVCFLLFHTTAPTALVIALKVIPTLMMCLWMLHKRLDRTNWPIFVGLLLSMTCDICMVFDGNIALAGGIVSNMLALLCYTLYFVRSDRSGDWIRLVPAVIVMGVFYFVIYDSLGANWLPVLVYCAIYTIFLWRASARLGDTSISAASQWVCFIGAVVITVSDCLLSFLLFGILPDKDKYYYMVMFLWWSGLFMLMVTAEIKRVRMRALRRG